jgi:cell division protein FtsQ
MWDKPQLLNWIASALYAFASILFLYGVLFTVVHLPIFPLREIRVEGELKHVTREQVKLIADHYLGGNFFTVNLVKTREAFQKLPWSRNVSIRRRWPNVLEVEIEEHQELARWGDIALVNSHGELFHAASDAELPVFYGPGDGVKEVAEHYQNFRQILEPVGLKVDQVTLSPRRSWELKTPTNMEIALGREDMEKRLERFAAVYTKTLVSAKGSLPYVDLRYPNGFAIRLAGGVPKDNDKADKKPAKNVGAVKKK